MILPHKMVTAYDQTCGQSYHYEMQFSLTGDWHSSGAPNNFLSQSVFYRNIFKYNQNNFIDALH